jgi:Flp pilus assembly secretin CpaC
MDAKRDSFGPWLGLRSFSWARFAVMMALIGTPCITCAWLLIRQPAPERGQPAQADSRPLVIVIPSALPAAQCNGAHDASPTPAPSPATTPPCPGAQPSVVKGYAQFSEAPHIAQPPTVQPPGTPTGEATLVHATATADAKEEAVGGPASLPGSVIQVGATNPAVQQLPPLPGPGEVPPPSQPAPAILPPATVAAPSVPAAPPRIDESTGATAGVALPPPQDGMQPPPPGPSLGFPTAASDAQDARKPLLPDPAMEIPAPDKLPIGVQPNHPMPSPMWSPPADMPQPTEQELEAIRNHIEGIVDPNCILDLVQGRTRLVKLKKPARFHVSGTEIIRCTPVNDREIAVQARAVGTAMLHLTFGDDKAPDAEIHYLVRVFPALAAREPYEAIFRALEGQIAGMFPESKVQLKLVGDAVLVTGQVRDMRDATTILQLVAANTPWAGRTAAAGPSVPLAVAGSGSPHVINRLQIARASQHQVALKVAVVEMSRSAAWSSSGRGPEARGPSASPDASHSAGPIVPVLYEVFDGSMSAAWGATALSSVRPANGTDWRLTSEPRPILLHNQPATVVASGQCLVTPSPDKGPTEQRCVTLRLHGIELSFTPVCVEDEPLRMTVAASAGPPGTGRQFHGTVAVHAGQTMALAGLLPPVACERDAQRSTGLWTFFGRFTRPEQPGVHERETVIFILPEVVGTH